MRMKRTPTLGAALPALASVSACGSDDATKARFFMGDNFAVDFSGSGSGGLDQTGLLNLNRKPSFSAPSGYRKKPALVDGCVLTDCTGN
ncbi:hypothetical protein ABZS86_02585 [Streptomyces sp. NPDC005355]|uniref:hypothetical protein n=1 Tax=Streptomyces sp. NPDC005355 TaxID=3157038 RepID=UPI0033AB2A7B